MIRALIFQTETLCYRIISPSHPERRSFGYFPVAVDRKVTSLIALVTTAEVITFKTIAHPLSRELPLHKGALPKYQRGRPPSSHSFCKLFQKKRIFFPKPLYKSFFL